MYIILIGCGRVGASLATALAADEHDVVVIDREPSTFANLGSAFNGLTVAGTGIDVEVLKRAGIEQAHAFVAVTSHDNANLMACQIAQRLFQVPRVIARINDPRKRDAYVAFGVDTICPTDLGAAQLRWLIEERGFQVMRSLGAGEVLLIRFVAGAKLAGRRIADVELPGKLRASSLERNGIALVPDGDMALTEGDRLTLTVRRDAVDHARALAGEGAKP